MATSGGEILSILRGIGEELIDRLRNRLAEQPRLTAALGTLVTAIALAIAARLFLWLFFSSPVTPLGLVSGRVTLDGQPLADVTVEFTPAEGGPSYGLTDGRGRYKLAYLPGQEGATVGEHTVRLTTYNWVTHDDGTKEEVPERLPARYNVDSQLRATVAGGSQTIDWELRSDGRSRGGPAG